MNEDDKCPLCFFVRLLKDFHRLLLAEICSHPVSVSAETVSERAVSRVLSFHWITQLLDYFDTEEKVQTG